MTDLQKLREENDQFFASDPNSPLTSEQKENFRGLSYFPENPALRLEIEVEEFQNKDEIAIQASKGEPRSFTCFGQFNFTVEGQDVSLTIYQNEYGLFLPFTDSLAGQETYGGGRYLEPEQLPDGKYLVDFNLAYNPYCVYSDRWSCLLTPFENRLNVPIRAGEKLPVGDWVEHH